MGVCKATSQQPVSQPASQPPVLAHNQLAHLSLWLAALPNFISRHDDLANCADYVPLICRQLGWVYILLPPKT